MSNTASQTILPRYLDPRKFAQQGLHIQGQVDVALLERLTTSLEGRKGNIYADLQFGIDEQRVYYTSGVVKANVSLICQRCLEPVDTSLEFDIALGIVWSDEQAGNLPKTWDPWILEDEGQANIYSMIEDEVILGLPIVAYHDYQCVPAERFEFMGDDVRLAQEQESSRSNAFQVLSGLKGSLKNNTGEPDS